MKPIIIKIDSMGNIKITEDELKNIVDEAYSQGYQDGQKQPLIYQPFPTYSGTDITVCTHDNSKRVSPSAIHTVQTG